MKVEKTNAMRILDKADIAYQVHTYEHHHEAVNGLRVASLIGQNPDKVYKTLLCISNQKRYYVFVIPVAKELDLKKCAKSVQEKSMEMIPVKDITNVSGYIRGGCSPIGMKKLYTTVFHESCLAFDSIIFSAGKIGIQMEMNPQDAIRLLHASIAHIVQ